MKQVLLHHVYFLWNIYCLYCPLSSWITLSHYLLSQGLYHSLFSTVPSEYTYLGLKQGGMASIYLRRKSFTLHQEIGRKQMASGAKCTIYPRMYVCVCVCIVKLVGPYFKWNEQQQNLSSSFQELVSVEVIWIRPFWRLLEWLIIRLFLSLYTFRKVFLLFIKLWFLLQKCTDDIKAKTEEKKPKTYKHSQTNYICVFVFISMSSNSFVFAMIYLCTPKLMC